MLLNLKNVSLNLGRSVLLDGRVGDYVGGYDDWLRQTAVVEPESAKVKPVKPASATTSLGLSAKERRELEALPRRIEVLETEQTGLTAGLGDPKLYTQREAAQAAQLRLRDVERELGEAYRRWENLEVKDAVARR